MRTITYPFSQFWAMLRLLGVMTSPFPATALGTEPHPLDTFLTNILNFREPPGIRGTVRYIDKGEKLSNSIGHNERMIISYSTPVGNWFQKGRLSWFILEAPTNIKS